MQQQHANSVASTSLEINHKSFDVVKKSQAGGGVAVKIEHAVYESAKMFGRHFDEKDEIYSHITRQSIDVLKVQSAVLSFLTICLCPLPGLFQGRCLQRRMVTYQGTQAGASHGSLPSYTADWPSMSSPVEQGD